ncbi:MAG: hypothetical protein JSU61_11460 [Fidelibacterota bacterium]|nr:MAG: hypothetical protein JSU61_11460 [Candidatus Neomarinimicrobiota bacterium]
MQISTLLRLYKSVGYIKKPPREVIFSAPNPPSSRLLFLFPLREETLRESRYVVQQLKKYEPGRNVYLAIANIYRDIIAYPVSSAFYFPVQPDDPPRLRMDVMLARFRNQTFDAVFNLDPEVNLQVARVMSVIKTPQRIGFTGPCADELYNIQVHIAPERRLKQAYAQMLQLCDLGSTDNPSSEQLSIL